MIENARFSTPLGEREIPPSPSKKAREKGSHAEINLLFNDAYGIMSRKRIP